MYGLDRKFKNPPHMKFFQVKLNYHFSPLFNDFFTPQVYSNIYRSKSSREDLGILTYDFWLIRSVFAPGITLLKKFEIYTGLGIEHSIQSDSEYDIEKENYTVVEKGVKKTPFVETGLIFRWTPFDYLQPERRWIKMTYSYYYYNELFHELAITGFSYFKLPANSIYQPGFEYKKVWGDVPFYHEEPVSSNTFKGFMGKSFYSRNIFSISNELRTSIQREFIYIGVYLDATVFEGSGYDLAGTQYGYAAGPVLRLIVLGQFEFYISYGKDLLISSSESQFNLSFKLSKKW